MSRQLGKRLVSPLVQKIETIFINMAEQGFVDIEAFNDVRSVDLVHQVGRRLGWYPMRTGEAYTLQGFKCGKLTEQAAKEAQVSIRLPPPQSVTAREKLAKRIKRGWATSAGDLGITQPTLASYISELRAKGLKIVAVREWCDDEQKIVCKYSLGECKNNLEIFRQLVLMGDVVTSAQMSVSNQSANKYLKRLRSEGYEIDLVSKRGAAVTAYQLKTATNCELDAAC